MPESSPEGKPEIKEKLKNLRKVNTILDVGPGVGTYKKLLKGLFPGAYWIGYEVWSPYITEFKLQKLYDLVIVGDIRMAPLMHNIDLVILGDMLEHMSKDEARAVFKTFHQAARYTLVSIPIIKYPQGPIFGNPYEEHKAHWTHKEVLETFKDVRLLWKGRKKGYYLALKSKKGSK